MLEYLKLCLVTHPQQQSQADYLVWLKSVLTKNGITAVQLRLKNTTPQTFLQFAVAIQQILQPLQIPLIINDNVAIAKYVDSAGIHLGQSDIHPDRARKILGPSKIIGLSIESFADLAIANNLKNINYVAASAVFPSQSKTDCQTIFALKGLRQIVKKSLHPVVAIGGIHQHNVTDVMHCGVAGVAVISAIHNSQQPHDVVKQLIQSINNARIYAS